MRNFIDTFGNVNKDNYSGYPEVDSAFKDWINNTSKCNQVLIGGMALLHYGIGENRTTTDSDFLFLSSNDIPSDVYGFKKHRKNALQHNKTHVEIEVLTSEIINQNIKLIEMVFETSYIKDGFKIASPSAIIALKLGRFIERDIKDIKVLKEKFEIDLKPFEEFLSEEELMKYDSIN